MSVFERVRQLVAEAFQIDIERVTADTNLRDLGDSLGVVELIMSVEEEFDIEVPDEQAAFWETRLRQRLTVGELAALIKEQQS